jgi:hypothetical protein
LIFALVLHVVPYFYNNPWLNYILQPWQVVWASAQSIFLRCLWS